ncbi:MAG: efflux RND transporter permease subunit, partial [Faecalibacillus sp.]
MSQFSVKKPLTVFVAVVLIIILGIVSFTNMSTDLLPSMDLPYVAIMATSVGDSPEKIEKNVTKPLERQLATAKGIKNIQSISAENMGIVIMEFYDDTDMNSVMIELSSKIDLANLDDSIPNPTILQINPDMMPVFVGAIDQEGKSINELSSLANDEIIPSLERVDGVASVTTNGLVENSISVSLNQNKINELNEKVLSQVDSTLADTKKKLNDGSIQLIQAKEQLRQQESKQTSQLVSGEIQLTNAINTLNMSLQSINSSMSAMDTTIMGIQQKITEAQGQLEILEKNGQDTTQLQDT